MVMKLEIGELKELRRKIITLCYQAKVGHIASSLSCIDVLYVLYKRFLNKQQNDFILSKGHAAPALYTILNKFGYLNDVDYSKYGTYGSKLTSHPTYLIPGIQYSSGALGLGLSVGIGMGLANKINGQNNRKVFVLMGDGELNEGSVWESFVFAGNKKMNNLIVIIDKNNLQASDFTKNIIKTDPLIRAIKKLGWEIIKVNGHDINQVYLAIDQAIVHSIKPVAIISQTTKGKGVSFMENNPAWHHRIPSELEYQQAIRELSKS